MTTAFGTEIIHPVYGIKPADAGGAVATLDSVNVKNYRRMTIYLMFGALTGNAVLTVKSGATVAVQTTSEGFRTRLETGAQGAAADADKFDALAARVTTLTLTAATYANKLLVVEVDLDGATDGQPWMTAELSNITALNLAALIILSVPRYSQNDMPVATE